MVWELPDAVAAAAQAQAGAAAARAEQAEEMWEAHYDEAHGAYFYKHAGELERRQEVLAEARYKF